MLLLEIAVILLATKLAGKLSNKFKQPAVLGQILVGLLLGPSVLGILEPSITLSELAEIGVILLMFIAGLETDFQQMCRSGKRAIFTALGGVVTPFFFGALLAFLSGYALQQSLLVGTILVATSVSITVQTLLEMKKIRTVEGTTILGAAVIDDILGILVLTLVVSLGHFLSSEIIVLLIKIALFFAGTLFFGFKVLPPVLNRLFGGTVTEDLFTLALALVFGVAYLAEVSQVAGIVGAYLMGVAFSQTAYRKQVTQRVQTIAYTFFVPIFFVGIGLDAQIHDLGNMVPFAVLLIAIAILAKIVGSGLGAKLAGLNYRQSLRVGAGMIPRAEVALIVASLGLKSGIIESNMYSSVVLMVLATTILTPPLLRILFGDVKMREGKTGKIGELVN